MKITARAPRSSALCAWVLAAAAVAAALSSLASRVAEAKGAPAPPPAALKGVVKGTVVGDDGQPIAGAKVTLEGGGLPKPLEATTDAKGAYAFPKAPVGSVKVRARAPAHVAAEKDVVVAGTGATTVEAIALDGAVRLAGKVTDSRGAPIAGADVAPAIPAGDEIPPGQRGAFVPAEKLPPAKTAADGTFSIDSLEPRKAGYDLRVSHPHFRHVDLPGFSGAKGTDRGDIDVTMEDAAWVEGVVTNGPGGKPVAGAKLGEDVVTDAQGRYVVGGIEAEEWSEEVRADGFFPGRASANGLVAGQAKKVDPVALEVPTATVAGVVVDAQEKPVVGATVEAYGDCGLAGSAKTDASGKFRLARVASHGPVTLQVKATGLEGRAKDVALNAVDAKVVARTAARMKAKVVDASGNLVPQVLVLLLVTDGSAKPSAHFLRQGADGLDFVLPPGNVGVIFGARDTGIFSVDPFDVEPGTTKDLGTITLSAPK
jgi:hypothetical protein